jgi:hypothetical protein
MTDTTTTHDVTYRAPEPITPELYALYERMAASAATSGLYTADGDTKATKEQCLMVLLYGHDLGVPTTAALQSINIFGDSMELSAGLLAGLIDRHPIYDYDAVVSTDVLCTINLFKHGVLFKTVSFGIADAQRAQLLDSPYYRQFPAAMMFARCMSTLVRRHCPGVTSGIPVYVAGETKAGLRSRDANLRNGPAAAATNDSGNGAVAPAADTPPHDDAPVSAEQRDMLIAAAMSAGFKPHQLYNAIVGLRGTHEPDETEAKRKLGVLWSRLPARYLDKIIAAIANGPKAVSAPPAGAPAPAATDAGQQPSEAGLPGEERISDDDITRLRADAAEQQIADGQLVNLILRVTGNREHDDLEHAATLLERVLRALPLRYLPAVFRTLQEMSAAATPQGDLGRTPAGTVRVGVNDMDTHNANGAGNGSGER